MTHAQRLLLTVQLVVNQPQPLHQSFRLHIKGVRDSKNRVNGRARAPTFHPATKTLRNTRPQSQVGLGELACFALFFQESSKSDVNLEGGCHLQIFEFTSAIK